MQRPKQMISLGDIFQLQDTRPCEEQKPDIVPRPVSSELLEFIKKEGTGERD
jgi:hypothetical protein